MKAVSVTTLLVFFILCIAIPVILLISFSLSLSVSKHHNFLLSTYEFIVVAKSNRVAIFFVFHVLFIALVFGSFKPSKEDVECYEVNNGTKEEEEEEEEEAVNDGNLCRCTDCDEVNENDYDSDGYYEDSDDDGSDDDVNSEEFFGQEIDSDLERRTEDFIAKVTRKWREELIYEKLMFMAGTESPSSTSS